MLRSTRTSSAAVLTALVAATVLPSCDRATAPAPTTPTAATAPAPAAQPPATPIEQTPAASTEPLEGPIPPGADTDDIYRVADARRLIEEMRDAYSEAPALTDYIIRESWFVDKERPLKEFTARFGPGNEAYLDTPESTFYWIDGFMYQTAKKWPDRFLPVRTDKDILTACEERFAGYHGLFRIHMALRYRRSVEEIVEAMGMEIPPPVRISSYRRITDNQGEDREVISLIAGTGSAIFYVDPETKFIREAEAQFKWSDAPEGVIFSTRLVFNPERLDALPEPIVFDKGNRTPVSTINALLGRRPAEE